MTTEAPAAEAAAEQQAGTLSRLLNAALVPILSVVLGLFAGAVVIVVSKFMAGDGIQLLLPLRAYVSMLGGALGSIDDIGLTLAEATPLILAGLALALGFKGGLFNIGANGQFLLGALGAAWIGPQFANDSPLVGITAALGAGLLLGAAYGFIPGALKAWTGAHEVVTTIMLNFTATILVGYLVTRPLEAPGFTFSRTAEVGSSALPIILGRPDGGGHAGILLALAAVPIVYWLLWRSTLGFEIRTVGANPTAARYAGIRPGLLIILTMSISGMLAGAAGAINVLGLSHYITASYSTQAGFDAITVALLGRAHPVGVLLSALLFGVMRAGATLMQIQDRVPPEIIDVIQGMILLFLAADIIVRWVFRIRKAKAGVEEIGTITRTYGEATR